MDNYSGEYSYFDTPDFAVRHPDVSPAQARADVRYLYGILTTTNRTRNEGILIQYGPTPANGVGAWGAFISAYDNNGSAENRADDIQSKVHARYDPSTSKLISYLDSFNTWICELNVLLENPYSDYMKRRMLFANLGGCGGITCFIQHCKDGKSTYAQSLKYLRENAHTIQKLLDNWNGTRRTNSALTNAKTYTETRELFNTMLKDTGNVLTTYQAFNSRTYRDSLQIPDLIWKELSAEYQGEID